MKELEQKTVEILDKLEALTMQYAPDVVDAAVTTLQVNAISSIIWGIFGVICVFICWFITKKLIVFCTERKKKGGFYSDWEIGIVLSFGFGTIITCVIALWSLANIFSIWNWVAIFNPQLALAKKVLGF